MIIFIHFHRSRHLVLYIYGYCFSFKSPSSLFTAIAKLKAMIQQRAVWEISSPTTEALKQTSASPYEASSPDDGKFRNFFLSQKFESSVFFNLMQIQLLL